MPKLYRLHHAVLYAAVFGTTVAVVSAASAEEIIIGAATAQTGGLAPYDQPALAGLRMAFDELNAKGGLARQIHASSSSSRTRAPIRRRPPPSRRN